MTLPKKRLEKPRTPNKFSVHVSTSNLHKLKELQDQEGHVTRNETINWVIESIHLYYKRERLLIELEKLCKQSPTGNHRGVL